jgi:hypothetical protein
MGCAHPGAVQRVALSGYRLIVPVPPQSAVEMQVDHWHAGIVAAAHDGGLLCVQGPWAMRRLELLQERRSAPLE